VNAITKTALTPALEIMINMDRAAELGSSMRRSGATPANEIRKENSNIVLIPKHLKRSPHKAQATISEQAERIQLV